MFRSDELGSVFSIFDVIQLLVFFPHFSTFFLLFHSFQLSFELHEKNPHEELGNGMQI